jgi:hypothetical protein
METKACLNCHEPIRGRVDKKFCDDYCRNSHNNELNRDKNQFVRNINHALRKNRYILESLFKKKKTIKVNKEELFYQGFQTKYHTHTATTQDGDVLYYSYEYGIKPVDNDFYMILKVG